jgi:ring-1,2-phenylacetyl-CoA epoxidase subunit PaaD
MVSYERSAGATPARHTKNVPDRAAPVVLGPKRPEPTRDGVAAAVRASTAGPDEGAPVVLGAERAELARRVAEAVPDPELPMLTLADLGILRDVSVTDSRVVVSLTPTYSGCPAMAEMRADVHARLAAAGLGDVEVRTVLSPPWSSDWITEAGRRKLAEAGIAPPHAAPQLSSGPVPLNLTGPPRRVGCPVCGSGDTERTAAFSATACKDLYRCRACAEPFEHVKEI